MAVLVSALVRLAFDVEINPSRGRIPIGGPEGRNSLSNRPLILGRNCIELYAFEPSFATECTAAADCKQYLVQRTAGSKSERQVRPRLRATERFRMYIEGHRCHCERRPGSNWRAVEISYQERLGADPTAQLIALSHCERHRREANACILRQRISLDAEGSILAV